MHLFFKNGKKICMCTCVMVCIYLEYFNYFSS